MLLAWLALGGLCLSFIGIPAGRLNALGRVFAARGIQRQGSTPEDAEFFVGYSALAVQLLDLLDAEARTRRAAGIPAGPPSQNVRDQAQQYKGRHHHNQPEGRATQKAGHLRPTRPLGYKCQYNHVWILQPRRRRCQPSMPLTLARVCGRPKVGNKLPSLPLASSACAETPVPLADGKAAASQPHCKRALFDSRTSVRAGSGQNRPQTMSPAKAGRPAGGV